jgi:hypothetical protein
MKKTVVPVALIRGGAPETVSQRAYYILYTFQLLYNLLTDQTREVRNGRYYDVLNNRIAPRRIVRVLLLTCAH